jgi:hypothetical protein
MKFAELFQFQISKRSVIALIVLLLCTKVFVLIFFSSKYTDQDQVVMWLGAKEMGNGNFHEPCFYGQSYNSMLESLFAVPLIKASVPYHIALPVITSILSLFPWILLGLLFMKRNENMKAMICLLFLLFMDIEFDIITSMPRGWVTGIFMVSLALPAYFNAKKTWAWLVFGFCATAGLWLSQNSIYLTAFIGYYLLIENWKKPRFYLTMIIGAIPPAIWWYFVHHYYIIHSGYNVHELVQLKFSLQQFTGSFNNLDFYFKQLGLVSKVSGWFTFFVTLPLIIYLFVRRKFKDGIIFLFLWCCFLLSLGISKVGDSHDSMFLSGSRFFLAFPFILCLILVSAFSENNKFRMLLSRWSIPAVIIVIGFKVFTMFSSYPDIEKLGRLQWVAVEDVNLLKNSCNEIQLLSKETNSSIIIFESDSDQLLNCACNCFDENFPSTLFPKYERRTWILKAEMDSIHQNVLFVRPKLKRKEFANMKTRIPSIYLLKDNTSKIKSLLQHYQYEVRPYQDK